MRGNSKGKDFLLGTYLFYMEREAVANRLPFKFAPVRTGLCVTLIAREKEKKPSIQHLFIMVFPFFNYVWESTE